jgi:hypothetical protein
MWMRIALSTLMIFCLATLFISLAFSSSSTQKRLSLQQKLEIFCEEIKGNETLCQEYLFTIKKRLEIKGELLTEIEDFCKKNNVKTLCRIKGASSISLYCSRYNKYSPKCQEWKAWKHKELELKGKLIENLQTFCKSNPKSRVCQN